MTELIDRLIFGTGLLYGGAYSRQSHALLDTVRRGGVTRFDTAPLYGAGSAEGVLGTAFGGDRAVTITTKVGLARPSLPWVRTWARRGLHLLRGPRAAGHAPMTGPPGSGAPIVGRFDPAFMAQSLEQSCTYLRRDPDAVLLHECGTTVPDPARAFLQGLLDTRRVGQVGFANGTTLDRGLAESLPAGWLAQGAVPAALLHDPAALPGQPMVLHGLIGMGAYWRQTDPPYARALEAVEGQFPTLIQAGEWPAVLPFCLAAALAPQAGLLYATSKPARAAAFLGSLAAIAREGALPALVATARSALTSEARGA